MKKNESKFPTEVTDFIRENHVGVGKEEMFRMVEERFPGAMTKQQIKDYRDRHHLGSGIDTRYKTGGTSPIKGKKRPAEWKQSKGTFSKEHRPINEKPIGHERVNVYGYIDVKVSNEPISATHKTNYKPKHRLVWEQHNGKIPEGYMVIFADGDRKNCDISNLLLVSNSGMRRMLTYGLKSDDPQITKVGANIAELLDKADEMEEMLEKHDARSN